MDVIIKARKCDGCGRVLAVGEGRQLPGVPPIDCCSQECITAAFSSHAAGLPTTAAAAAALAASQVKGSS